MIQPQVRYKPKNFIIEELVPKKQVKTKGIWRILSNNLLISLDTVKEELSNAFKTRVLVILNDYHKGGNRENQCYRPPECYENNKDSVSQHRWGRAADPYFLWITSGSSNFTIMPIDTVRNYILENPDKFPLIGAVELPKKSEDMDWLHFDTRPRKKADEIYTFTKSK